MPPAPAPDAMQHALPDVDVRAFLLVLGGLSVVSVCALAASRVLSQRNRPAAAASLYFSSLLAGWYAVSVSLVLLLRVALKVDRTRRAADAARMRAVFDAAGRVLEKRAYLGGAAPSDADVCLAAIGAVAILVSPAEGYGGGACVWRMPDRGLPADMRAVYAEAIAGGYRFYSYGDACLLIRPA